MKRIVGLLAMTFAVVLAAGSLAACGDDDGGDDAESTEEATDDGGTDDGGGEGGELDAEDIVITEDDLEGGDFGENPDAADDTRLDDAIETCADEDLLDALDEGTTSEAEGLDYADEAEQLAVSSRAVVVDDEDLAADFFDLVTGDCIGEALSDGFNEDLSNEDFDEFGVTREPLQDAPSVGEEIGGFRFTLDGEGAEGSIQIVSDYIVVQEGTVVAFLLFSGVDTTFPVDDEEALIETVAERMEA